MSKPEDGTTYATVTYIETPTKMIAELRFTGEDVVRLAVQAGEVDIPTEGEYGLKDIISDMVRQQIVMTKEQRDEYRAEAKATTPNV